MKPNRIMCMIPAGIAAGIFMFSSCHSGYSLASVEGNRIEVTAALDANPDSTAIAILTPYQKTVDSIMSPVIGQSARFMDRFRPESELSNLVADILRCSASAYIGRIADVGVTNMGGLRTALPEGDITYGNIYEITPFENTLCIVTMNGSLLRELFENIAAVHGEGLSGACLEISGDGKLLDATVAGKEIEDSKEYKVATLDYLAEGNDHMTAFAKVGIIALIDEATGYQYDRTNDALRLLLSKYVAKGLQKWLKIFPDAFFAQLDKLYHNAPTTPKSRPQYYGKFINRYVYNPIENGYVKAELDRLNITDEGKRIARFHQWLTDEGKTILTLQIGKVQGLMEVCTDIEYFKNVVKNQKNISIAPYLFEEMNNPFN